MSNIIRNIVDGTVTIDLNGKLVNLSCTPGAAMLLSQQYAGLIPLFNAVQQFDFGALVAVINVASGRTEAAAGGTPADVIATGFDPVAQACTTYLGMLTGGGRVPGSRETTAGNGVGAAGGSPSTDTPERSSGTAPDGSGGRRRKRSGRHST